MPIVTIFLRKLFVAVKGVRFLWFQLCGMYCPIIEYLYFYQYLAHHSRLPKKYPARTSFSAELLKT